jgi:hypothetical protein
MVPCYTIVGGLLESGIPLALGARYEPIEPPAIDVGEPGRGRLLSRVPVPTDADIDHAARRLMAVPVSDPRSVAVLLIRDHSGYRGSWWLCHAATSLCPRWQTKITGEACTECRGEWEHNLLPLAVEELDGSAIGRLIATGHRAQGQAGRMGGGPEYLIAVHPGRFGIRRTGRLYGRPARLNVTVRSDGSVLVEDAAAVLRTASAVW